MQEVKTGGLEATHVEALETLLGASRVRHSDVASTLDPGFSAANLAGGVVVTPQTVEQVQNVVRYCARHSIEMVPQGGRTGLSGGAESAPGQLIIETSQLNKVLGIDRQSGTAVVESGVCLQNLQEAIEDSGFSVGVDLAARGSATLGGMVSTNAGGTEAFRHGMTRHRVLGIEAVLANGELFDDLKQVAKANEGLDIKQLLIGAEGTLGIITKVALSLVPASRHRVCAMVSCESASHALDLFRRCRVATELELLCAEIMWPDYARTTAKALGLSPALEFAPGMQDLFVVLDVEPRSEQGSDALENCLMSSLESGEITSAVVAKNDRQRERFWQIREESFLCDRDYPHGFWYDVSVPHAHLDDYAGRLFEQTRDLRDDFKVFLFGHLGDGNLHLTITAGVPVPELESAVEGVVYDGLHQIGGSFSAEHGIGRHKRGALKGHTSASKVALMRAVKHAFDPDGLLNPGKIL